MYLLLFFTVLPVVYLLNLGLKWQKNIVKARKSGIEPVTVGRECLHVMFLDALLKKDVSVRLTVGMLIL
jgi:hypothetical protein